MKSDDAFALLEILNQLDEVEGASVVPFLDRVGDTLQFRGGTIQLSGKSNAQILVAKDSIVVHCYAAVGGHQLALGRQDQRIDLCRARFPGAGYLVQFHQQAAQIPLQ